MTEPSAPIGVRRPPAGQPRMNRAMSWLLRSKLHRLVSGSLALFTYVGTMTGNRYTLVIQYVEDGDRLLVWVGRHEQKRWWRNLRSPAPVTLRLRGVDQTGTGCVIASLEERTAALARYLERYPRTRPDGRPRLFAGRWQPSEQELAAAAADAVFIAIALDAA